ncbi:ComEC/Rec2 family competence protein [Leucobacter sp. cx-169]|nr:ComEC/Rec2 family competence protein [Leucobacter sp. cx-169]
MESARASSPLVADAAAHRTVTLLVTLTAFPRVSEGFGGERGWVAARTGDPAVPVLLWLEERAPPGWAPGTQVSVRGALRALAPADSAAFGIAVRSAATGSTGASGTAAASLRAGLLDTARGVRGAELVPGLAVGDTSLVSEDLDVAMRESSLAHLTAVSGANCALVTGAMAAIAARLGAGRRLRVVISGLGLAAFVAVVGPDPSVLRAGVMAVVVLVSRFGGRPEAGFSALGVAILALLVVDPWQALQAGFALSVAATAGILLLAAPLTRAARALWLPKPLAIALAVASAAQFACGPFLLLLQPGLPAIGVAANVVAGPAAPLGTALGLVAALVAPFCPPLAVALVWLAAWPARWIAAVAETAGDLPLARWVWPEGWGGAVVLTIAQAAAVLAWLVWTGRLGLPGVVPPGPRRPWQREPQKPRAVRVVATVLLSAASALVVSTTLVTPLAQRAGVPRDWAVVMCDVGQGDAILLRDPAEPDRVMLVDTGDDAALLSTCLDRFGVTRISLLVLTHDDQDHVGALDEVIGRIDGALIAPPTTGNVDRGVVRQLEAGGVPFVLGAAGNAAPAGQPLSWRVLAPGPRARPDSTNEASLILLAEANGLSVLLLGDSGQEEQAALLRAYPDLRADVVKVGHHGSRDREPGLPASVDARLAIVSVGAENRYGHPNHEVVAEFARARVPLLRTDEHGSIAVTADGEGEPGVWVEVAEPRVSGRR